MLVPVSQGILRTGCRFFKFL